jgi:hypothetical protein
VRDWQEETAARVRLGRQRVEFCYCGPESNRARRKEHERAGSQKIDAEQRSNEERARKRAHEGNATDGAAHPTNAAHASDTGKPTAARRMDSASDAVTDRSPFTSQTHSAQPAVATAVRSATSASEAVISVSKLESPHAAHPTGMVVVTSGSVVVGRLVLVEVLELLVLLVEVLVEVVVGSPGGTT